MVLRRLLDSGGCGKDVELAVGEDAVYVEEKEFDFPGAEFSGLGFGHCPDSSIAYAGAAVLAISSLASPTFVRRNFSLGVLGEEHRPRNLPFATAMEVLNEIVCCRWRTWRLSGLLIFRLGASR